MKKVTLGISTCPNDTFAFDALLHGRIKTDGLSFDLWMGDILQLNDKALKGELDVVKISYHTLSKVKDTYQLLKSGSAMGKGVGPLLVTRKDVSPESFFASQPTIAVPGFSTTANLLMNYFAPDFGVKKEMLFSEIPNAVKEGKVDAGVIIHEHRFTFEQEGLKCMQDLGAYWEDVTGFPIPLGAIVAKKSLGDKVISLIENKIAESVQFAFDHPADSADFVKLHAQEMSSQVCKSHIDLYVNEYTLDIGETGLRAVEKLLQISEAQAKQSQSTT